MEATTEIRKAAPHPTLNTVLIAHIQTRNDMSKPMIEAKKTLAINIAIPIRNGPTSEMMKAWPRVTFFPETIRPAMNRTRLIRIQLKTRGANPSNIPNRPVII
ncbi:hypothetical protein DRO47_03625 [Candidatus Bathyarchaeota archaeon]|nr:MAG: hypothetical protein DRO28_01255 [Candidatus Bathyarchaeota archaeon]RLI21558.1 MAG: hypothetical protein DRO47_03625 [Candidatus Bathyarchaeota archaeon]